MVGSRRVPLTRNVRECDEYVPSLQSRTQSPTPPTKSMEPYCRYYICLTYTDAIVHNHPSRNPGRPLNRRLVFAGIRTLDLGIENRSPGRTPTQPTLKGSIFGKRSA